MEIKMSTRKKHILRVLVDRYIETGIPVSSSDIQRTCLTDISSATIRNELSALEEMGYLVKQHISSGRVPSPLAYKYYAKYLARDINKLPEVRGLEQLLNNKLDDIETIMKKTAKIISDKTNYTSIVMIDKEDLLIENIKLIDLQDNSLLVIIITNKGALTDKKIRINKPISEQSIQSITRLLNEIYSQRMLSEVEDIKINNAIYNRLEGFRQLFCDIIDTIKTYNSDEDDNIYLEGANNIFSYKEYDDIDNVRKFLSMISKKDQIKQLMQQDDKLGVDIKIGINDNDCLDNMAMVSLRYQIGGMDIGKAAVLGPERMDYKKVIKVLADLQDTLENIIIIKEDE